MACCYPSHPAACTPATALVPPSGRFWVIVAFNYTPTADVLAPLRTVARDVHRVTTHGALAHLFDATGATVVPDVPPDRAPPEGQVCLGLDAPADPRSGLRTGPFGSGRTS